MIVYGFSLPVKQVRFDTYYFRLMLVLVIPQIENLDFVFNLKLHIVPMFLGSFANKLSF